MGLEISLYDFVSVFIEQNRLDVLLRREAVYNDRDVDEILVRSVQDAKIYNRVSPFPGMAVAFLW